MDARDLIRRALIDAIQWQESYAESWDDGKERADALALAKKYRQMLKRRYGDSRTPMEQVLGGAKSMSLDDIRKG